MVDGGQRDGVQYYFIDCPELFDRKELYGPSGADYTDNAERFGLFCRAVIEASKHLGVPDVFHVHDWQAALIPVYLRTVYLADPDLLGAATVLTIHNAAYQGAFPPKTTEELLLPWEVFTMDKLEQYDHFNFLKGGVVFCDQLTTVSKKYAEEIQTPEFGEQLDGVLLKRAADLHGILNGVDYALWNPATDGHLAAHYTAENLAGKRACRADLLHAFGLQSVPETTPVIGIVSRFAKQKGFDILAEIAEELAERDVAVVALGTHDPYYENLFRGWAFRHPANIAVQIRYDETLAHKIEAGSDMFLMPSRYEPCGLNQIYSLKYGTVPIVRATGGLDDTIEEWDAKKGTGTGFKFEGFDPKDLLAEIDRAIGSLPRQEGLDAPDAQRHGARLQLGGTGERVRSRIRGGGANAGTRKTGTKGLGTTGLRDGGPDGPALRDRYDRLQRLGTNSFVEVDDAFSVNVSVLFDGAGFVNGGGAGGRHSERRAGSWDDCHTCGGSRFAIEHY